MDDIRPACPYPYFNDIGYKYHSMPPGLSIDDYFRIIEQGNKRGFVPKKIEDWSEADFKDYVNEHARLQILSFLEFEKEWTEYHYRLLAYAISDLDFYASERQFREVSEQCLHCKQ